MSQLIVIPLGFKFLVGLVVIVIPLDFKFLVGLVVI